MASDNETVEEIVSEMRRDAIAADAWCETHGEMASAASVLNRHANRIEAAHKREVDKLNFDLMTIKSEQKTAANVIIEQTNRCEALKREIAELRECLRVSSNAMEMVVQWLGRYPKWQDELKYLVAENRKALEGAKDDRG